MHYFIQCEEESDSTVSVTPAASSQSSDVPCPINLNATPLEVPLDSSGYCTVTTPIGVSQPQKVRTAPPKCGKCSEHSNVLPLADSFVGNCLVYVIIPQKCISKSDSIEGLQNTA